MRFIIMNNWFASILIYITFLQEIAFLSHTPSVSICYGWNNMLLGVPFGSSIRRRISHHHHHDDNCHHFESSSILEKNHNDKTMINRSEFWKVMTREMMTTTTIMSVGLSPTLAATTTTDDDNDVIVTTTTTTANKYNNNKRIHISDSELKAIVSRDVIENQFLTNGQLTRSIYDESATFTDEIDTYTMDKWILGTQRLFVGDGSSISVGGGNLRDDGDENDWIVVTKDQVEFRFDEQLMFNIPLLVWRPVVHLTGKVVLKRSLDTGLITSYQEFWDQDVVTVLKSAKLVSYP
jgi:hypothetical protein